MIIGKDDIIVYKERVENRVYRYDECINVHLKMLNPETVAWWNLEWEMLYGSVWDVMNEFKMSDV